MTDSLQQVLSGTLDYLMTLSREGARPAEAKASLRRLQQQYPNAGIDLLWEEEAYDRSVHYDALLHLPGDGTVSLSFCPDRALPWPMRGVHRWREADLVRVNTRVLTVEQAISCLDSIWDAVPIINRLVNMCLIQEALDADAIQLSDAELQHAMDGFRRTRKLYTAADTYQWMEEHGMTHEQLEQYVTDEALVVKLRDQVTAGRVEAYFDAHHADFDMVRIAQFECADEACAHQTYAQIRRGEVDFYAAAERQFLAAAQTAPLSYTPFAMLQRRQTPPELGTAVFAAAPGQVLPPVRTDTGYRLLRVLAVTPASLDDGTRRAITDLLFEAWLAERRQAARIEWYWGGVGRTEGAVKDGAGTGHDDRGPAADLS